MRELLEWLRGKLAAGLDAASAAVLAVDALDRAVQSRSCSAAASASPCSPAGCSSRFSVPGWRLDALRWPNETLGELVARGPDGEQVDVRFTLGVRGNRSQVGVDFQLGDGTDERAAKTVVTALVALLRAGQSPTVDTSAALPH